MTNPHIPAFSNREVSFKFRGRDYVFSLSHAIFSSAGLDTGSRFLLKVFSHFIDEDIRNDKPFLKAALPLSILDAGSGCGVLGICAAGALLDVVKEAGLPSTGSGVHVRTQDRDELARVFTKYNACQNNIPADILEACTEPLLAGGEPRAEVPGPDGAHWDLTLTNIPAKAGRPVLEDFVRRSAALLNPGGRVFMVAVNTLADFFREQINAAGAELLHEEQGAEHTVFVYGCTTAQVTLSAIQTGPGFLSRYPFYLRNSDSYEIENISCPIDAVYGCGDFDSPGDDVLGAAKLCSRIGKNIVSGPWLVHEPCQGHFAVWLTKFMGEKAAVSKLVLSGRNILALEASQHNLASHLARLNSEEQQIIPASDLLCDREALLKAGPYSFIAAFPEIVPQANRHAASWEALETLLTPGGVFLISLSSADAERFDRLKPKGFSRLGDIKRKGFRALAYGK